MNRFDPNVGQKAAPEQSKAKRPISPVHTPPFAKLKNGKRHIYDMSEAIFPQKTPIIKSG